MNWQINIVTKRYVESTLLAGLTINNKIYLFSYPGSRNHTKYVVDHEIGHLVRFRLISDDKFKEYLKMRKYKIQNGYFNQPEELFAEDFYWLFGSQRNVKYRPNYIKPGWKERKWIIETAKRHQSKK